MRFHEIISETENPDGLMTFWELVSYYKLEAVSEKFNDAVIPWLNRNTEGCINRLITSKKARLYSKLLLYKEMTGERNYAKPLSTPQQFEAALSQPVTMYRGGGKVYDPNFHASRGWVSFTTSKARVETFSKYNGTRATRSFSLPIRDQYWIVELDAKLDDVLLYIDNGGDHEVIVSTEIAKHAKVIEQTEKGLLQAHIKSELKKSFPDAV